MYTWSVQQINQNWRLNEASTLKHNGVDTKLDSLMLIDFDEPDWLTQIDVISEIWFLLEFYLNLWCILILTWISFHIWCNLGDYLKGLEFLIVSNWSWIHKIGLRDFVPCLVQIPSKPRCWFLGSYHA